MKAGASMTMMMTIVITLSYGTTAMMEIYKDDTFDDLESESRRVSE